MIFLYLSLLISWMKAEPIYLIEIFRYGARVQKSHVDNSDPFNIPGEITPVGLKQHYLLGKQIRKDYSLLFGDKYTSQRHQVYSSNQNNSVTSAYAHLFGQYDLESGVELEANVPSLFNPPIEDFDIPFEGTSALPHKFMPISVISSEKGRNLLFGENCKSLNDMEKHFLKKRERFSDDFEPLKDSLKEAGFNPEDFNGYVFDIKTLLEACDYITSKSYYDSKFKKYPEIIDQCDFLNNVVYSFLSTNTTITKIANTSLFRLISKRLSKIDQSSEKVISISALDTNFYYILSLFFPENYECVLNLYKKKYDEENFNSFSETPCLDSIKFASSLLIEVSEDPERGKLVSIRLNGEYLTPFNEEKSIKLPGFITLLRDNSEKKYDALCLGIVEEISTGLSLLWIITLLMILIEIGYLLLTMLKNKNEQMKDYNEFIISNF